jgi:hypothetical protein
MERDRFLRVIRVRPPTIFSTTGTERRSRSEDPIPATWFSWTILFPKIWEPEPISEPEGLEVLTLAIEEKPPELEPAGFCNPAG